MRIGIDATAIPVEPAGAGMYTIQLIRALAALASGYEFVVFTHAGGRQLIGLPEEPSWSWITVPEMKPARRLLWEQTALPALARRSGLDLLHSPHYTRPVNLSCTSVVTFHDMTFLLYPHLHTRAKRLFFPLAMRMSARKADVLIAVSECTRQDALRLLVLSPDKIITAPNGVSENFHQIVDAAQLEDCRRKYRLPEEFILNVGTIEPRKNLPLLLKAYHRLATEETAPKLVVVGNLGWNYAQIWQTIQALGLEDSVIFPGYIPSSELPIVYNLARLFVYPSLYEGFGFPPLEAMACGTPVVTSAISAMRETVAEAGMLVPPQDEGALTQAMGKLLKDSDLRRQLSEKGLARAAQFTWKRSAQETLKAYQLATRQT